MKNEILQINIPSMGISEAVEQLGLLYCSTINAKAPLNTLPTPFFWGSAGIGKSDGVYQLGNIISERTGKKAVVTDVRLLLFSPVDLRGVPVADDEKRFTNWLMPKIFDMNKSEDYINILFLDELSAAPQSVQASAYQICLDRKIGEFKLPDNCIVIAAGNRTTDQSVSYKMPKALCNRLMHFNIKSDYESWRAWAVENRIHDKIIAFLGFDNSRLCVDPESSDLAYATPRSWTFVSTVLKNLNTNIHDTYPLIAACVGNDIALEFEAFCMGCANMPSIPDVLAGRCVELPKTHDIMYAMVSGLIDAVKDKDDELSTEELDNACIYATRLPKDFCMTFMKDLSNIPNVSHKLAKCQGFQSWLSKNKRFI